MENEYRTNEADIEAKHTQEVQDRQNLEVHTNNNIARLDQLHSDDDARLTQIEGELKAKDVEIDAKITERINDHNADVADLLTLKEKFVVDEGSMTITIPAEWKFVIAGSLEQGSGGGSTPPPTDNNTPDPIIWKDVAYGLRSSHSQEDYDRVEQAVDPVAEFKAILDDMSVADPSINWADVTELAFGTDVHRDRITNAPDTLAEVKAIVDELA